MSFFVPLMLIFAGCISAQSNNIALSDELNELPDHNFKPFVKIGSKYYYIEEHEKLDWIGAVESCRRKGGYLADIESAAEAKALNDVLMHKHEHKNTYFWLGGSDISIEGEFHSINTGDNLKFNDWHHGQPDNFLGNEDGLRLWNKNGGRFAFDDGPTGAQCHYICELKQRKHMLTVW